MPYLYGVRYHRRTYTLSDYKGFFYGYYVRLEYRKMAWEYREQEIDVSYSFSGGERLKGTRFHSLGGTAGGDIGFRWHGEHLGGSVYLGAGLPLFFCFGDLPPKDYLLDIYFITAMYRAFEFGFRIDFFL